jgi:hypothetical protein
MGGAYKSRGPQEDARMSSDRCLEDRRDIGSRREVESREKTVAFTRNKKK